jgi:MoaA/NifB/PqqE/SkfB family radical SAM enzyme
MSVSYQSLRQLPRLDLAASVPLRIPLTVHVEPTNVCNMKCSFCPVALPDYAEQSGFHGHMTMELYVKIMSDLLKLGRVRALRLYLIGEPFLNPELAKMTHLAHALDVADRIEITTNGTILPFNILTTGLDYLRVSVYTPRRTKITRNVEALVRERDQRRMEHPYISVKFMPVSPVEHAEFLHTYEGVADELEVEPHYHNWASTSSLTHIQATERTKENCPFVHYMMVIKANGDVVPCCVDWKAMLKIGNVHDQSLADIWHGVGQPESAGINRHVVGDERALQERKQRIHPGLESCRRHREMSVDRGIGGPGY